MAEKTGVGIAPAEAVVAVATATGAALLPDLDHTKSTARGAYGPVTKFAAWLAGSGARGWTHSLLTTAAVAVLATLAAWSGTIGTAVVLMIVWGPAAAAFRRGPWLIRLCVVAAAAAAAALVIQPTVWLVATAVGFGYLVGVLGDAVTTSGAPLLWPASGRNLRVGWLRTGGAAERGLIAPASVVGGLLASGFWLA